MITCLRSPPPAFEDASRAHFRGLRHKQLDPDSVSQILNDAPEDLRPKLRRAYADLAVELRLVPVGASGADSDGSSG